MCDDDDDDVLYVYFCSFEYSSLFFLLGCYQPMARVGVLILYEIPLTLDLSKEQRGFSSHSILNLLSLGILKDDFCDSKANCL